MHQTVAFDEAFNCTLDDTSDSTCDGTFTDDVPAVQVIVAHVPLPLGSVYCLPAAQHSVDHSMEYSVKDPMDRSTDD